MASTSILANAMQVPEIDDELMSLIRTKMNTEEQQLFMMSFALFLKFGRDEFVIDLDDVWEWAGFARKSTAKRVLVNDMVEGTDYKCLLHSSVQQNDARGGHNKEVVMMKVDVFKHLCIAARTEKGRRIRQYFITMEDVLHDHVRTKLTQETEKRQAKELELARKSELLHTTEAALQNERRERAKLLRRNVDPHAVGPTVYVVQSADGSIKVGHTGDMNTRMKQYPTGKLMYCTRCFNSKLIESIVLHVFDENRMTRRSEWLINMDVKDVIDIVDSIVCLMDGLIGAGAGYHETGIRMNIVQIVDQLRDRAGKPKFRPEMFEDDRGSSSTTTSSSVTGTGREYTESVASAEERTSNTEEQEPAAAVAESADEEAVEDVAVATNREQPVKNILDIRTFISECFEVVDESEYVAWSDIVGRYRLWSRSTDKVMRHSLREYFKSAEGVARFKVALRKERDSMVRVYMGLRMKPLPPLPVSADPKNEERFVQQCCRMGVNDRVSTMAIDDAYKKWLNEQDAAGNDKDVRAAIRSLHTYLNAHFLKRVLHDGTGTQGGYYGIALKDSSDTVGRRYKPGNKKRVEQIDVQTQAMVETFASVTEASEKLGISLSRASTLISTASAFRGTVLRRLA